MTVVEIQRHAMSCNNLRRKYVDLSHGGTKDPLITASGAKSLSLSNESYDFVCCSPLRRAVQTALGVTAQQPIYVVPFVAEKRTPTLETSVSAVSQRLQTSQANLERIRLGLLTQFSCDDWFASDWDSFTDSMLPVFQSMKDNPRILIVSHAGFIKHTVLQSRIDGQLEVYEQLRNVRPWSNLFSVRFSHFDNSRPQKMRFGKVAVETTDLQARFKDSSICQTDFKKNNFTNQNVSSTYV